MAKLPQVRDYMDTEVPTLNPEMEILDAVNFLLDNHVTGAPVVNGEGTLIGILTEKDCLRLLATGSNNEFPSGTVADFMTARVETIRPHMNVYFVAGLFLGQNFRRFPVVDEAGRVVGAITRFDILRAIKHHLGKP